MKREMRTWRRGIHSDLSFNAGERRRLRGFGFIYNDKSGSILFSVLFEWELTIWPGLKR